MTAVSARAVRLVVIVVCIAGVAGMIVTSALKHNGAALTFGLITAVAILCLMVATAVTGGAVAPTVSSDVERLAAGVEADVVDLLEAGADETAIRDLVRDAVRLGRARAGASGTSARSPATRSGLPPP
jgi:hypothetical protein